MTLRNRRYWIVALVAMLGLATAAVIATSTFTSAGGSRETARCAAEVEDGDHNEAQNNDRGDEGCKDLLPQASITPSPTQSCGTEDGLGCAPDSERVDLVKPSFSEPTTVTNALFPISDLRSAVLLGKADGEPLRVETTLLRDTRIIDWNGQKVETLVSQYVAYLDGRIHEVALDFYAQADDGSVWYFGEDVFNYEDGVVADTEGTWLAGRDGPAAMIMPAEPQVGDVYRPENIPGLVFEEVTVKSVGVTVDGPSGPVAGAIIVEELHMDGSREDKTFAPAYGEFSTGNAGGDLEAIALAVPTDALPGPPPAELKILSRGAAAILAAAQSEDWDAASTSLDRMTGAWETYQAGGAPPMLDAQMSDALEALREAVDARDPEEASHTAIDVAQASLDLQLRHRAPAEIDGVRFDLWARQLLVDAGADDPAAVRGDVATLEWVWDRFAHTLGQPDVRRVDRWLAELRVAADAGDLAAATDAAERLLDTFRHSGRRTRYRSGRSRDPPMRSTALSSPVHGRFI